MTAPSAQTERRVQVGVRLPESLHAELAKAAAERELSTNRIVTEAVRLYLGRLIPIEELLPVTACPTPQERTE